MIPKKILLCCDFSEFSEQAREAAVSYAKTLGASLVILNVINTRLLRHPALIDLPVYETAVEDVRASAEKRLNEVTETCRSRVSDVKAMSRIGVPGEEIVKVAAEEKVDLIIMGPKGRTGLGGLLLGSAAEMVVKTAPCDVLTVRSSH